MPYGVGIGPQPINFQKTMVFIDGTNLFYRLEAEKFKLKSLIGIGEYFARGRQLIRTYLYTSPPHYEKAKTVHGENVFREVRVVLGDALEKGDGNWKEKGVDALLVADLIYHAAVKNYDYAILISTDADFAKALKRVEDFGCRTAVVSICSTAPELLRLSADDVYEAPGFILRDHHLIERID